MINGDSPFRNQEEEETPTKNSHDDPPPEVDEDQEIESVSAPVARLQQGCLILAALFLMMIGLAKVFRFSTVENLSTPISVLLAAAIVGVCSLFCWRVARRYQDFRTGNLSIINFLRW